MSDGDILVNALQGYIGDVPSVVAPATQALQTVKRRSKTVLISDAATAGTAVTETNILECDVAIKVISVQVSAPIAVTASDSTYATFTVAKRTAGGSPTTLATQTTKTTGSGGLGTLTAFKPYALTNQATVTAAAGDSLTVAVAKASTGVALTAATSYVAVTVLYEET